MPAIDVVDLLASGIDHAQEHAQVPFPASVLQDHAVQGLGNPLQRVQVVDEGAKRRLKIGHYQGGADPFSLDISHDDQQSLRSQAQEVVVVSPHRKVGFVQNRDVKPVVGRNGFRQQAALNSLGYVELLLHSLLFEQILVKLGIFESQSDVSGERRKEVHVFVGKNTPFLIQQLQGGDDRSRLVSDGKAEKIGGPKSELLVQLGIESRVGVDIRNVQNFSGFCHMARDSGSQRKPNFFLFQTMGDQRPDFISFSVDKVNRSSLGAHLGFGHFQNLPQKFREVQSGAQGFTGFYQKTGFSKVPLNLPKRLPVMQCDGGKAGVKTVESQVGLRWLFAPCQRQDSQQPLSVQQGKRRGELQPVFETPTEERIFREVTISRQEMRRSIPGRSTDQGVIRLQAAKISRQR